MPNNYYFDEGTMEGSSQIYGFFQKPAQEEGCLERIGTLRQGLLHNWYFSYAREGIVLDTDARAMLKAKLLELNAPPLAFDAPDALDEVDGLTSISSLKGDPMPEYLWYAGRDDSLDGSRAFFRLRRFTGDVPGWLGDVSVRNGQDYYSWTGAPGVVLSKHEWSLVQQKIETLNGQLAKRTDSPFEIDEDDSPQGHAHTVTGEGKATTFEFPVTNPKTIVLDFVPGLDEVVQLKGELLGEGLPLDDLEDGQTPVLDWGPFPDDEPTTGGIPKSEGAPVPPDPLEVDERRRARSQLDAYGEGDATFKLMCAHARPITPTHEAWLRLRESLHKLPGLAPAVRDQMLRDHFPDRYDRPKDSYLPPIELTQEYLRRCAAARDEDGAQSVLLENIMDELSIARREHAVISQVLQRRDTELASVEAMRAQERSLRERTELTAQGLSANLTLAHQQLAKAQAREVQLQEDLQNTETIRKELEHLRRDYVRVCSELGAAVSLASPIARAAEEAQRRAETSDAELRRVSAEHDRLVERLKEALNAKEDQA
jgi:hypothetical protein